MHYEKTRPIYIWGRGYVYAFFTERKNLDLMSRLQTSHRGVPEAIGERSWSGLPCPQDREVPHWVLSRLTRTVEDHQENDSTALQDADPADPVEGDPKPSGAEMGDSVSLP